MSPDPWHVFSLNFGQMPNPSTGLVTLLDLAMYKVLAINVSRARGVYKVKPPSVEGPEAFQRIYRVHQNMGEALILHLPLLWIASFAMDDIFAASLGTVWLFARFLYARGYYQKAKRRTKGFVIGMIVDVIFFATALTSIVASL